MKIIFPTEEFERKCREQQIFGESFLAAAFEFWLDDSAQLRSPFPAYTHEPLIQNTFQRLMHWAFEQTPETVNEDLLSEIFQAIITEEGTQLVQTDDERLTILHPNFPRIADAANLPDKGAYQVVRRHLLERDEKLFLKIYLLHNTTKDLLETEFDVTNA
jgi:hypothetical protein